MKIALAALGRISESRIVLVSHQFFYCQSYPNYLSNSQVIHGKALFVLSRRFMLNTFRPFLFCLFSAANDTSQTSPFTRVDTNEDSTKVAYDC